MKTIEELKNECVRIFGLEHDNTKVFFQDIELNLNVEYYAELLEQMIMYDKINHCEIAHVIVRTSTNKIVVVEMVNKFFDFYASAFVAIRNAIEQIEPNLYYIEILNIITD